MKTPTKVQEETAYSSGTAKPLPRRASLVCKSPSIMTKLRDLKISSQSENVNMNLNTGGDPVYLWYKSSGPNNPIRAISVITNKAAVGPFETAKVAAIKKNLNKGNASAVVVYLCYCV